jgi:iron complex outermembrane receptor protein
MNSIQLKSRAFVLASCLLIAHTQLFAQEQVLESVVVIGENSKPDSIFKPFSIVPFKGLDAFGVSTLGEALRSEPGMSATGFGPNASRPIVRGQDSDRIKILRNSAATIDVSALSFDHALPVDPFALYHVEVLRGPSALAYGGNAVGGAINLVDQRIARQPVQGFQGEINLVMGGASQQISQGFKLDTGLRNGFNIHLDGFKRRNQNLKTPTFTDPDGVTGRWVQNSSSKSDGAAIAGSFVNTNGYMGLSIEQYNNDYGVPKSLDVRIGMENERYAIEGEQNLENSALKNIKYRLAKTDYQHQEFENGMPATLFMNDGLDGRVELSFQAIEVAGVIINMNTGLQFENTDFSAVGDEAFVPRTSTDQKGVFTILRIGRNQESSGMFEFGLRADQIDVNAASSGLSPLNGPVAGAGVAVGPAINRTFSPHSLSLGYSAPISHGWSVGSSLSHVERAPSSFELYADGVHVASAAYEKGNPILQEERGRHIDLTAAWVKGLSKFNATAFSSRYSNYIALIARTGVNSQFNDAGELINVFDFTAVPAEFHGIELGYQMVYELGRGKLKPSIQYDLVRGKRTDIGGNLPRINPQRLVIKTAYALKGWSITPEIIWMDDSQVGSGDVKVNGYELVNLRLAKSFNWGDSGGDVFLSLANLTNKLAYSATTLNTVRSYTPLEGRAAQVGVKLVF